MFGLRIGVRVFADCLYIFRFSVLFWCLCASTIHILTSSLFFPHIYTHSMSPYFTSWGWSDFSNKFMALKLIVGHSHLFTLEPAAIPIVLQYFHDALVPGAKPASLSQLQLQQQPSQQQQQQQQAPKLKEILELRHELSKESNASGP